MASYRKRGSGGWQTQVRRKGYPPHACDVDVKSGFEKFTRKQLRTDPAVGGKADPAKFLAELLVSESPYDRLIESYIYDLTGSSLQSAGELFKAAAALDIDSGGAAESHRLANITHR